MPLFRLHEKLDAHSQSPFDGKRYAGTSRSGLLTYKKKHAYSE
jgi:hypothetical protein